MLNHEYGVICLLSLVLTNGNAYGPFHSTVDVYGQAYYVTTVNGARHQHLLVNIIWESFLLQANMLNTLGAIQDNWLYSVPLGALPKDSTKLVVAARNNGTWNKANPAGIIFSSDTSDTNSILSDAQWKCKGFAGDLGEKWPIIEAKTIIQNDVVNSVDWESWLPAVEPDLSFKWGLRPKINLGTNWIWAAGNNEDGLPLQNVICVKQLR